MALTPGNVDVALNGRIYVAPVGTTAPVDATTAWGTDWADLGYMTDDGVEVDPSLDFTDIPVWQDLNPVRSNPKSATTTFKFTCVETSPGTVALFLPDATITQTTTLATIAVPAVPGSDFRAFGFEWNDGDKTNRICLPKGLVKDRGSLTLNRNGAAQYELTVTAYSNGTDTAYTWLSDNPSMVASS